MLVVSVIVAKKNIENRIVFVLAEICTAMRNHEWTRTVLGHMGFAARWQRMRLQVRANRK